MNVRSIYHLIMHLFRVQMSYVHPFLSVFCWADAQSMCRVPSQWLADELGNRSVPVREQPSYTEPCNSGPCPDFSQRWEKQHGASQAMPLVLVRDAQKNSSGSVLDSCVLIGRSTSIFKGITEHSS